MIKHYSIKINSSSCSLAYVFLFLMPKNFLTLYLKLSNQGKLLLILLVQVVQNPDLERYNQLILMTKVKHTKALLTSFIAVFKIFSESQKSVSKI